MSKEQGNEKMPRQRSMSQKKKKKYSLSFQKAM
jgi:hypothetical protein